MQEKRNNQEYAKCNKDVASTQYILFPTLVLSSSSSTGKSQPIKSAPREIDK